MANVKRMSREQYNSIANDDDMRRVAHELGYNTHSIDPNDNGADFVTYQARLQPYEKDGSLRERQSGYEDFGNFYPEDIQKLIVANMIRANAEAENRYSQDKGKPLPYPEYRVSRGGGFDGIDNRTWNEFNALRYPASASQYIENAQNFDNMYSTLDGRQVRYGDWMNFQNSDGMDNINYLKNASRARANRNAIDNVDAIEALQRQFNAMQQAAYNGELIE